MHDGVLLQHCRNVGGQWLSQSPVQGPACRGQHWASRATRPRFPPRARGRSQSRPHSRLSLTIWPSVGAASNQGQGMLVRAMAKTQPRSSCLQGPLSASRVRVETGTPALRGQRSTAHLPPFLLAWNPRTRPQQWPSQLLRQLGGHPGSPQAAYSLLPPCCQPQAPPLTRL